MVYIAPLLLAAAAIVSATPIDKPAVVPLKHVNNAKSARDLVESGKARIAKYNGPSRADVASGSALNADVTYLAPVIVGSKTYQLIVDTGSSNTWVGANQPYSPGSTGKSTGGSVAVTYGSGQFSGTEYTDKVSYAGLTVLKQSIGVASSSSGFNGVDGIFGLGPVGLTRGTVSNADLVPTFLDNLYAQKSINPETLGVYFKPESGSSTSDNNGELTLGGTDTTKYTAPIVYVPTLKTGAASNYWGVAIASITYGSTTLASGISGIVDTGTTLIYIPAAAYNTFLSLTSGTTDPSTGLAIFNTKPTGNVGIKIGSTTYTLTPAQYLIPAAQYGPFGLNPSKYYAWINNGGTGTINTIIGQKFLENYYSVYDTTNARIGFATRK